MIVSIYIFVKSSRISRHIFCTRYKIRFSNKNRPCYSIKGEVNFQLFYEKNCFYPYILIFGFIILNLDLYPGRF